MFRIPRQYYEEIIAHLRAEMPNEGCGLLGGTGGEVLKHYPAANAERSPMLYSIHPNDLLGYIKDMHEQGWDEPMAIYHSHTHSEAYPSRTDVQAAGWPDSIYLIVSLQDADNPVIRGFRIEDGVISEEEIVLADPP